MVRLRTRPRLGVVIDRRSTYDRRIAVGASRFATEAGLSTLLVHYGPDVLGGDRLRGLGLEAAVVSLANRAHGAQFRRVPVPVVNVHRGGCGELPDVVPSASAAANLVVRRAMELGYVHIGAYTYTRPAWSEAYFDALACAARDTTVSFRRLAIPPVADRWRAEVADLVKSVATLSRPRLIVTPTDDCGRHVIESLRLASMSVPGDAAVLGMGNDELLCDLAAPKLSSVDLQVERVGYEAARAVLSGDMPARESPRLVAPGGIVARQSFGRRAFAEPLIAACHAFIEAHADRRITVPQVAAAVGASRRTLERKYRAATGQTLASVIRAEHIERARWLLAFTDKPIKRVARDSGFSGVEYFTRVFRAETGESPGEYRGRRRLPMGNHAGGVN